MISARTEPSFDGLAARLVAKAQAIAEARLASWDKSGLLSRRWRQARWLWPLFTGR